MIRLDPESAWTRGNFAAFLIDRGKYDEAIAMAEQALELMDYPMAKKTLAEAHAAKAVQLVWRKQLDEAERHLVEAERAFPVNADVYYSRGVHQRMRASMEQNRQLLDDAKRSFERAVALEPKHRGAKAALDEHASYEQKLSRYSK